MVMTVESDIRQAELEIRAWLAPTTPAHEIVSGLLQAYQVRNIEQKEAFVAALLGRVLIKHLFASAKIALPSANS
jgi:hypothetical protein